MQYDRMLTKNYAIEICNILNEEDNETIDFNLQFKGKGDHKGIAISLFIGRRQFEFNIYNIHHEQEKIINVVYIIDAVHPILRRVVKFDMSYEEMSKLHNELLSSGYETENIILTKEEKKDEN